MHQTFEVVQNIYIKKLEFYFCCLFASLSVSICFLAHPFFICRTDTMEKSIK